MDFFFSYVTLALVYVLVAISSNVMTGLVGIFSVSQAAIFGVGAYATANLMMAGVPFVGALAIACVICVIVNVLFALPALRVAGDYFVVTSFGIQLVASTVFDNWTDVTGGAAGLFAIPLPSFFGFEASETWHFMLINLVVVIVGGVLFQLLKKSAYGRLLVAIRQDETAVLSVGKSIITPKVQAAAVAGAYAALGGGLYATYLSFIDPVSFDLQASILIISMMVLGGTGTLVGALVGPFLLLGLPMMLAFIDMPSSVAAPVRQLIYGVMLVLFMMFRPQGIAGNRI